MDELVFLNPLSATATLPQQIKMLKQQLAAALEREKLAMECIKLYADEDSWMGCNPTFGTDKALFIIGGHGFTPAQECQKKVEAMK